ncbi:MAG: tetratricopeptide repeat protein [Spirochaetales bacterium]|nr:tetratricopeptide repeat protein [Spirochaetales bacterium]
MSSNLPIVKQINIVSILLQLSLIAILIFVFYQIDKENYMLYSFGIFIVLTIILRYSIPHYHRKGVAFYKKGNFEQALPCFEASYLFFKKYRWIDKYRFITILSSSRISYTEMALLNKAFCLGQIGKKDESIKTYKQVLEEFPNSKIAESTLRMME